MNKTRELLGKAGICGMHRMECIVRGWFECALIIGVHLVLGRHRAAEPDATGIAAGPFWRWVQRPGVRIATDTAGQRVSPYPRWTAGEGLGWISLFCL